jgi:hypothetical protein
MSKRALREWRQKRRARRSWIRTKESRRKRRAAAKCGASNRHAGRALPLLVFLRDTFVGRKPTVSPNGRAIVRIPKLFSFIRNADETNETIRTVVAASLTTSTEILLDYENCEDMDLCASLVLGLIAREMTREWRAQGVKRRFIGTWSKTGHVNEVMRCTGIIRHLQIRHEAPTSAVAEKFETFDFKHGFTTSFVRRSSFQEKAAQELTDHLGSCFRRLQLQMSGQAEDDLVELIGEVMDNAERHSSRNEWWAQAYFDQSESSTQGVCHLAIVSLGQTIADSLKKGESATQTETRIRELVQSHERGSLLGMRSPLTEENLWTFYALQDGVSCTTDAGAGSGTVRLIEHFQQLSRPDEEHQTSRMTVTSGNTQVLFDKKYSMQPVGGRKVIAFNQSNSLEEPPSSDNVRNLKHAFPGTIIALRFQMEKSYLQQLPTLFPIE